MPVQNIVIAGKASFPAAASAASSEIIKVFDLVEFSGEGGAVIHRKNLFVKANAATGPAA
jgi:hypothetical protein